MEKIWNAKLLDSIIEASFDGIYITDGESRTLRMNTAYEMITGLKKEDLLNKSMAELVEQGIVSESGSLIAIREKKPVTLYQEFQTGKQALITSSPVLEKDGTVVLVVTNVRDMTEIFDLKKEVAQNEAQKEKLEKEIDNLREKLFDSEIVARDRKILSVLYLANRVAPLDATVLLTGETGAGKEMFAKYIHQNSKRENRPFVKVNCGAIPQDLIESELFGYEKGAFTGANKEGKAGLFEAADKGTIFLDEIGELPFNMQVKLLRVLQEGEIERIGSTRPRKIDVRVISATNRDLAKMVDEKSFRQDLYYRLNVFPVVIPPLRERPDDIEPLTQRFLAQFNRKYGMQKRFSREASICMKRYDWPGNIRELKNVVERAMIVSTQDEVQEEHLPTELQDSTDMRRNTVIQSSADIRENMVIQSSIDMRKSAAEEMVQPGSLSGALDLKRYLETLEQKYIEHAVKQYGNVRDAARSLGMTASTLVRKRQRYVRGKNTQEAESTYRS